MSTEKIVSSSRDELILGDPLAWRATFGLMGTVFLASVPLFALSFQTCDFGSLAAFVAVLIFFGGFGVFFLMAFTRVTKVITRDEVTGTLVVTTRQAQVLGAWPWLRRTEGVPLQLARSGVDFSTKEYWTVSPSSAVQRHAQTVTIPTVSGNSLVLYDGEDVNVALTVRSLVSGGTASDAGGAPGDIGGIVERHRRLTDTTRYAYVVLAVPLVMFVAAVVRTFGC